MKIHHYIITGILLLFSSSLFAQNDIGIGEWKSHLPYRVFTHLTQSEETLFCATEWSIMTMDKEEMSVDYMSTIDGLSNTGMGVIKYSASNDVLIVSYSNSIFDLIRGDGSIRTFSELKTDGNFTDRAIYDIDVDDAGGVVFSTGFGIVKFNSNAEEFEYTLNLGIRVNAAAIDDDIIYAATEDGIYYALDNDEFNLQDINNWSFLDLQGGNYSSNVIGVFNGVLYMDVNDVLHKFENNILEEAYPEVPGFSAQYLTTEGKGMLFGLYCGDGCNGKTIYFDENGVAKELGNNCTNRPQHGIEDSQGRIWLGDNWRGLRLTKSVNDNCDKMEFESPLSHNSSQIEVSNGKVYIASGGVDAVGNFAGRSDGVFINDNGTWEIINRWTVPYLEDEDAFLDFYKIAIHPESGKPYYGTFWGGLVEQNGDEFIVYNDSGNSTLQGAIGDEARERISGLYFDEEGNLWMSNHAAPRPISVLTAEGEWKSFNLPEKDLRNLVVDRNGYVWCTVDGTGQGVIVFDGRAALDGTSTNTYRIFSSADTELPDNNVTSLAVDLEGDVWIGTFNGVVVADCGSNVFDPALCGLSRRVIEENDFDDENEYLLKGEVVTAIAIDGADRKWFGTTNGVFVQSASGKSQVAFFNNENSPLFDNSIITIGINEENGEVFIGTDKGVISYRSEAVKGDNVNSSEVYAFPNPVRPNYQGPIAVKGLAQNANVKITDINGQLVYETTALGGQAIWDGTDYNGRRANSGVYLVFSTSDSLEFPDAVVAKILFIN